MFSGIIFLSTISLISEIAFLFNYTLLSFLLAFIIAYISIPPIVKVAKKKELYARSEEHATDDTQVPILGSLAIFAGLILSSVIFTDFNEADEHKYIIAGLLILFFLGMKDDILIIDPMKKLLGQIIAAGLVVVFGGMQITSFQGFLGIYEITAFIGIPFTIFVFIVIINGFNLIDGIDGLASGVGILVSLVFGAWFLRSGFSNYAILSFALAGSLSAFFHFNVFGRVNKIFMGNTGSHILGFIIAILSINYLECSMMTDPEYMTDSAPAVAFGILIIPLFDILRVFTIRIYKGRSPFVADHKHVHHLLLELGCTHLNSTLILLTANALFIFMVYKLQGIGNIHLLILILSLATILSPIPCPLLRHKRKNSNPHLTD